MFGCDSWAGTTSIGYLVTGAAAITPQSNGPLGSSSQTTLVSVGLPVSSTTTVEHIPSSTSPQSTPLPTSSVPSGVNTAAAIGGALGGFASVVLAILALYKFWTKKNKEKPLS
ncbi:hypothetical protein EG329_003362 [Mollisiaceae sp. DMI_Dod_QoI]|nr:hypothetical protein EG329_003362 [Helotiales sp. DMI_Dod_QoI]